jgi:hypothetical protein
MPPSEQRCIGVERQSSAYGDASPLRRSIVNIALWIVQGLLAALFLFGGVAKLTMPIDELAAMMGMPGAFILFIAIAEILGAFGLVLPWALRILPGLTPLAASGLVIIMIGATVLSAMGIGGTDPSSAVMPLVVGLLAAFVAYGRTRSAPKRQSASESTLQPAV